MTIDFFYKIVHLAITLIVISFFLYIWNKYRALRIDDDEKNSYSLLFFSFALILFEYNLFDNDYRYEVITTIIVDSLLLVGVMFFNNGVLFSKIQINTNKVIQNIVIVSIVLLIVSNILITNFYDQPLIGYSLAILYTLITLFIISYRILLFFKQRDLLFIGLLNCLFFLGFFITIPISLVYSENTLVFNWTKICYLIFSFGIYIIMILLGFHFINDLLSQKMVKIFSNHPRNNSSSSIHNPDIPLKELVHHLISKDRVEEIIEKLLSHYKTDSNKTNTVLMMANQIASLNTARLRGIVNNEEYNMNRARVVDGILSLLNDDLS